MAKPATLRGLLLLVVAVSALVLTGCGGGGGQGANPPGGDTTPSGQGTARFHVNVSTGQVTITPLTAPADTMNAAAVFTGTAVQFNSTVLYDQPGSTGLKVLDVSVVNRSGLALGKATTGTDPGLRVIFGEIANTDTPPDIRAQAEVATLAGTGVAGFVDGLATAAQLQEPVGVAVDDQGGVYIGDCLNHRIRKLSSRMLSTVVGNGTPASVSGSGTLAQVNHPCGLVYCPRDQAIYIAERYGNRISRLDSSGYLCSIAGTGTSGGDNGAGNVATFNNPVGLATDGSSVYVVEFGGNRVRKILYSGSNPRSAASYTVYTVAGSGTAGTVDGVGGAARFNGPWGLAWGDDHALYVAELNGRCLRRIESVSHAVTTIAGTGASGSADGLGTVATFNNPAGVVALPNRGRGLVLVVSEASGHVLRQLRLLGDGTASPAGPANWLVQTLAGQAGSSGNVDGDGATARFYGPSLLAADDSGNVLVADRRNHELRRLRPNGGYFPLGVISGASSGETVALANPDGWYTNPSGSSYPNYPLRKYPGLAVGEASAPLPWAFAVPDSVTAFDFTVRVEAATSVPATPEAGSGVGSARVWVRHMAGSSNGFVDGPGAAARFSSVCGVAELNGFIYLGDFGNCAVRRVDPDANVHTIAGVPGMGSGFADGTGATAQFNKPGGIAAISGADCPWSGDPRAVYLFVADDANHRIRLLCTPPWGTSVGSDWEPSDDPSQWQVATIAGTGVAGKTDGRGNVASFNYPGSLCTLAGSNVYVTEYAGNRVRLLQWRGGNPTSALNWEVSLAAGDSSAINGVPGTTDGYYSIARFDTPFGVAADRRGYVYIADMGNNRIRVIDPTLQVSTLAGSTAGYLDGQGTAARFWEPRDLTLDEAGYAYVTDRSGRRIRRVSRTGLVTTVAGTGAIAWIDGPGNVAAFDQPNVLTITPGGDLVVFDNHVSLGGILRLVERVVDIGS